MLLSSREDRSPEIQDKPILSGTFEDAFVRLAGFFASGFATLDGNLAEQTVEADRQSIIDYAANITIPSARVEGVLQSHLAELPLEFSARLAADIVCGLSGSPATAKLLPLQSTAIAFLFEHCGVALDSSPGAQQLLRIANDAPQDAARVSAFKFLAEAGHISALHDVNLLVPSDRGRCVLHPALREKSYNQVVEAVEGSRSMHPNFGAAQLLNKIIAEAQFLRERLPSNSKFECRQLSKTIERAAYALAKRTVSVDFGGGCDPNALRILQVALESFPRVVPEVLGHAVQVVFSLGSVEMSQQRREFLEKIKSQLHECASTDIGFIRGCSVVFELIPPSALTPIEKTIVSRSLRIMRQIPGEARTLGINETRHHFGHYSLVDRLEDLFASARRILTTDK